MTLTQTLLWFGCGHGSDDPQDLYCPVSSFAEAATNVYCNAAVGCGAYVSAEVCVQTTSFTLDCQVPCEEDYFNDNCMELETELVFDPTDAEPCLVAMEAFLASPKECERTAALSVTDVLMSIRTAQDGSGSLEGPGVEGCAWLAFPGSSYEYERALCVAPADAEAVCE
jgi:hypothetical protein